MVIKSLAPDKWHKSGTNLMGILMDWKRALDDKNLNYWVDLVLDDDNDNWYKCSVRWNGCIHFWRAYNDPFNHVDRKKDDIDYIHICELDEFIEILTKLRDTAKKYFASHDRTWPD